jgi:hypothetical protein
MISNKCFIDIIILFFFFKEPIPIHRMSAYLFGRDRLVADIPTDHPSCSQQHAVLQFRLVPVGEKDELGLDSSKRKREVVYVHFSVLRRNFTMKLKYEVHF